MQYDEAVRGQGRGELDLLENHKHRLVVHLQVITRFSRALNLVDP